MSTIDHVGHALWGALVVGVGQVVGADSLMASLLLPLATAIPRELEQGMNKIKSINEGEFSWYLFRKRYGSFKGSLSKIRDASGFVLGGFLCYLFF